MARTRYRDWDGKNRVVQCTADTRPAAERELKKKLSERSLCHPGFTGMSADSAFPALVDYWIEDMDVEDRLSRTTRQLYERNMSTVVLPFFEDLTLREIGVARCDHYLKQLAKLSYNRARQARVVLRLALALTVRHELIPRNPMDHVSRLRRPPRIPDSFTPEQITRIRAAIRAWQQREIHAGPRPDEQLGQVVEIMHGTSALIGEVLAIRLQDLDLDGTVPMMRIAGTFVSRKGEPTHRQEHPKTFRSVRRVALPAFALVTRGGGIDNVATVLIELAELDAFDVADLARQAPLFPAAAGRRIGYVLERFTGRTDLEPLRDVAHDSTASPSRLDPGGVAAGPVDRGWMLYLNSEVEPDV